MDQQLFLDFEYVFAISIAIVLLIIYLFYVRYPYDADIGEKGEEFQDDDCSSSSMSKRAEK
jgi:hypothetical protein